MPIDYSSLQKPTQKTSKFDLTFISKRREFKWATDIFEFVEDKNFIGEKLFPEQRRLLEDYYNTLDENGNRIYQEMVLISGMRSGKTRLASYVGTYELHKLLGILERDGDFVDYFANRGVAIGIGQRIYIVIVAAALDQAESTVFGTMKGIFENANWYKSYISYLLEKKGQFSQDKYEMRFKNRIYIKAEDSNSNTLVGKTIHTLLFDEISRLSVAENEISKKTQRASAQNVYQGLTKGTTTFSSDRNIIITSAPFFEDDYGMQLLLQSGKLTCCEETEDIIRTMAKKYPLPVGSRIGHHSTSFAFNPYVDAVKDTDPLIVGVRNSQPLVYKRDYLALPPANINAFFEDPDKIDSCVVQTEKPFITEQAYEFEEVIKDGFGGTISRQYVAKRMLEINPNRTIRYFLSCDPAVRSDIFALGIGHGEWAIVTDETGAEFKKVRTVIDYVTGWKPDKQKSLEVNFDNVTNFIKGLKVHMDIECVCFDAWSPDSFTQKLHSAAIRTKNLPITVNIYEEFKKKINSGLAFFPDSSQCEYAERLLAELKKLQIIRGNQIDHPANFGKDLADSCARISWMIDESIGAAAKGVPVVTEQQFFDSFGGSTQFRENVLKKIYPVMGGVRNEQGPRSLPFRGVSL